MAVVLIKFKYFKRYNNNNSNSSNNNNCILRKIKLKNTIEIEQAAVTCQQAFFINFTLKRESILK